MSEPESVEKKRNTPPRGGAPAAKNAPRSAGERLRAVKLHLEEGFPVKHIAEEVHASEAAIHNWIARYRAEGEEGLKDRPRRSDARALPEAVRQKIVELKKEEPTHGVKRISQILRRIFFLPASSETVRQTLHKEGLVESPPKPRRNVTRPQIGRAHV